MIEGMNFGFSGEMIFLFFLAPILFGPKKMPEIGRQVARFLGEFRRASNEFRSQIEAEVNSLETTAAAFGAAHAAESSSAPRISRKSHFQSSARRKAEGC